MIRSKKTVSVHAGKRDGSDGVVNAVEPSSAFRYVDEDEQPYPRYFNTPNQKIVIDQICSLENAESGLVFGSGMAAISTTLLSLLNRGDHAVFQEAIYGGTHSLIKNEFDSAGIEYTFAACDAQSMIAAIRPNTKVVYAETPSNPMMEIIDLEKLGRECKNRSIVSVTDNTFATPINQNPIHFGIDLSIHSGTKYLGGHSDLCFGAVVGSQELIDRIQRKSMIFGASVNAQTCYLIERSIKTLAIRVERQSQNAMQIAGFLNGQKLIESVYYPGLSGHAGHEIAQSQMTDFGGMLSFRLNETVSVKGFLKRLELITPAMSLGGVESTVTIPSFTSHKAMPVEERLRMGINEQLVRLSVGIESADDLMADLQQALEF